MITVSRFNSFTLSASAFLLVFGSASLSHASEELADQPQTEECKPAAPTTRVLPKLHDLLNFSGIVHVAEQGLVQALDGTLIFCALDPKLPKNKQSMWWINPASKAGGYGIEVRAFF